MSVQSTNEVTSGSQLSDIITAIYHTQHHLDEIPPIKEKIQYLQTMLRTLEPEQVPSDSLETNLRRLQAELNEEVKKKERQENTVISGIKNILKNEEQEILNKVASKSSTSKDFENYCKLLKLQVQKHGQVMQDELNSIRTSIQQPSILQNAIEDIKTSVVAEQDRLISMINQKSKDDYQNRFGRLTEIANKLNVHENLRLQTNNGIQMIKQVNAQIDQERKKQKEEEEERQANDTTVPDSIKELVVQQWKQCEDTTKAKIKEKEQQMIKEYEGRFEALEKQICKAVEAMAQHKLMTDDARIWLNLARDPAQDEEKRGNPEALMREINSARDDITEISHGIATKMKEVQDTGNEESQALSLAPKKRVRSEGEDLDEKIKNADTFIQQLDDYISQFKEAVLDPMFPIRVDAAMKKIKQILMNHETYIAYLMNPSTVTKDIEAGNSREVESATLYQIFEIVQKQKDTTTERLNKRLKTVEDSIASL